MRYALRCIYAGEIVLYIYKIFGARHRGKCSGREVEDVFFAMAQHPAALPGRVRVGHEHVRPQDLTAFQGSVHQELLVRPLLRRKPRREKAVRMPMTLAEAHAELCRALRDGADPLLPAVRPEGRPREVPLIEAHVKPVKASGRWGERKKGPPKGGPFRVGRNNPLTGA